MLRMKMVATVVTILAGVTAPVATQVLGRQKLPENLARKYWGEVLVRCGDRFLIAENYSLFVRVTEYRGNLSLTADEFILDKAWLAANRVEARGTLIIRFAESRSCRYSKDHPEFNAPWSAWLKPINGVGAAFPFSKAGGQLTVSAGVVVRIGCDTIDAVDAISRKN
ncbi:MAG: hypothetical protein KA419_20830 [Acidobacteria bacterium]|nr:hypothetical protein [Acidobacteriota bacterium]